ncbi:hypothetical protein LZD49_04320 [Dyadobacter sp. CY261]|uniref:hypothetical protein n=1 Tax=Dyadobacter sp. CY261 TaxID=2907203 RepID=UPI001F2BD995|nr:hypothetical protein [Dyadobacter sp. CY261]MCF0069684.1 hypothetical protein [Dyadobacter sp. CY261]
MKNNLIHVALRRAFFQFAVPLTMMAVISGTFAKAASKPSNGGSAPKSQQNLTTQIRRFLEAENTYPAQLTKAIVVISFLVDENNQLKQVVSHSQIPAVDNYFKSKLEGKRVQIQHDADIKGKQQFVKLRFSIEN